MLFYSAVALNATWRHTAQFYLELRALTQTHKHLYVLTQNVLCFECNDIRVYLVDHWNKRKHTNRCIHTVKFSCTLLEIISGIVV